MNPLLRPFAVVLVAFVSICVHARSAATPDVAPLVVTHAVVWTSHGSLTDSEIVISDGRVTAVGRSGSLARPANARVIDANGDTLLPGLIDAHVHLPSGVRLPPEFNAAARVRVAARQLLRSGVTSGRIHLWDLPSATEFKQEAATDNCPSPRFQFGGPALFGGQPDWYAERGNVWGVKSAEDAVTKVRRLKDSGMDWVALHQLSKFQPGELDAIVSESRRLGLRLFAGGDRIAEARQAVELGVESIEYLDRSETPRYPDELIARMRERGTTLSLVPTIGFPHRYIAYRQGAMKIDEQRLTEFMPTDVAAFAATALRDDQTKDTPNAPKWKTVPPTLPDKFRQLRDAGLQVVVGTDCGSPFHIQADAIWWELETWRQLGVPPHDIIRAATTLGAALLRERDAGHLNVGARGDFVLYRGRIEEGPLSADRVRTVAKSGILFVNEGQWIEP